jgi:hypothetical protein
MMVIRIWQSWYLIFNGRLTEYQCWRTHSQKQSGQCINGGFDMEQFKNLEMHTDISYFHIDELSSILEYSEWVGM